VNKIALSSPAAFACLVSGCGTRSAVSSGPAPAAPPGYVKISPQKISETPTDIHWKWSIVGDRNWSDLSGGLDSTISKSYPLTGSTQAGGSNVVVYDLDITAAKNGNQVVFSYWARLSSASGTTSSTSSPLPGETQETDLRRVAVALVTSEIQKPIPGKISLLRLEFVSKGGKKSSQDIVLNVAD